MEEQEERHFLVIPEDVMWTCLWLEQPEPESDRGVKNASQNAVGGKGNPVSSRNGAVFQGNPGKRFGVLWQQSDIRSVLAEVMKQIRPFWTFGTKHPQSKKLIQQWEWFKLHQGVVFKTQETEKR